MYDILYSSYHFFKYWTIKMIFNNEIKKKLESCKIRILYLPLLNEDNRLNDINYFMYSLFYK
jgi:hypothetical protein